MHPLALNYFSGEEEEEQEEEQEEEEKERTQRRGIGWQAGKYMRKTKPIIIWQRRQAAADNTGSGEQLDR